MRRSVFAQAILSLLTTPDRAEALAGDLIEDGARYGPAWFWCHLLRSGWALFLRALSREPLRAISVACLSLAALAAFGFSGAAVVLLFPGSATSLSIWFATSLLWWSGAVWTSSYIVGHAPRSGMAVCILLAILGESAVAAVGIFLRADAEVWPPTIHASALFAFVPFLAAAILARRRAYAHLSTSGAPHD